MDFSINNFNLKQNKINFKGMEGAYSANSTSVYKFIAPPHKRNEKVFLEIVSLNPDDETASFKKPASGKIYRQKFKDDDTCEIKQESIRKQSSGLAYRYVIENEETGETRYELDQFKKMPIGPKGTMMNVIEQGQYYGISPKGGAMRHSFLDSDVKLDASQQKIERNKEFVRNHFNKLSGNISGLNWLLKNSKELEPYRYFMTTPDIGADKVSSHKYWPTNNYQCSDLDAFKEFNFELFKRGKGYVADGAFTSQGLQSPLSQHVFKWGKESPFYNMLKIDGDISIGVLPDESEIKSENPYNHIGVRLVNPKGKDYDNTKGTYIQFYDDRLLSPEKQIDGQFHFDYDTAPEDHYEITTHQDSIQPYAFEIKPRGDKFDAFEGKRAILLKDIKNVNDFLKFPNFTIAEKNKVTGINCWDGNVDMIKMNLSNPQNARKENVEGCNAARNYIFGVATYWTETVQSNLILETAKLNNAEKAEVASKNNISETRYEEIKKSINNPDSAEDAFNSLVLRQNKTATDYIRSFPLQTLETNDELSAIFAQPNFQDKLLASGFHNTEERLHSIFDETIEKVLPDNYKDNHEYRAYVIKTYANEILRHTFASAMRENSINEDGTINKKELQKVTLRLLANGSPETPEEEVNKVIDAINKGLEKTNLVPLQKRISDELKDISLEDFKLSEAIVLQGKGGLNWRFDAAKDVGDLDAVRDGKVTFSQVWDDIKGVETFWTEFVARIRKCNPASYVINEITSLSEFSGGNDKQKQIDYDPKLAKIYNSLSPEEQAIQENQLKTTKQFQFLSKTNSTTTSEFSRGFNQFSEFAGTNPEKNKLDRIPGDVAYIKEIMERLAFYDQPNSVIFSHMFICNHDKPSVLHTLPLDIKIFQTSDLTSLSKKDKEDITNLTGIQEKDFDILCPKAVSVGLVMEKTIEKGKYTNEEKAALKKSLRNLVNGMKTDNDKPNFKRAESFGVKPYEITIGDLFKGAGMYDEDKVLDFHYAMLKDSMVYYERLWQVMNACIGTPTLFGGNEFAQTGYETPSKNVYLGIRNEVLHHLKDDKRYKDFYTKMYNSADLYQKPGLSALRDGTPISLEMTYNPAAEKVNGAIQNAAKLANVKPKTAETFARKILGFLNSNDALYTSNDKYKRLTIDSFENKLNLSNDKEYEALLKKLNIKGGDVKLFKQNSTLYFNLARKIKKLNSETPINMWPLYKKDSTGSQVISIITDLGMPKELACNTTPKKVINSGVNPISLKEKNGRCPIENGTILGYCGSQQLEANEVFAVYNDAITICKKDGNGTLTPATTINPKTKMEEPKKIILNDTVATFYVI